MVVVVVVVVVVVCVCVCCCCCVCVPSCVCARVCVQKELFDIMLQQELFAHYTPSIFSCLQPLIML
jgi:hypothetical protein